MFGMVAATGARILTGVDFKTNRYNLFVVAISVGFGMIPLVAPNFFRYTPDVLHPLLESGILLAAIVSVAAQSVLQRLTSTEAAFAKRRRPPRPPSTPDEGPGGSGIFSEKYPDY
jgi:xanthine/uracil permease